MESFNRKSLLQRLGDGELIEAELLQGGVDGAFADATDGLKNVYGTKEIEAMLNEEQVFVPWLKRAVPAGAQRFSEGIVKFGANLNPPQNVGMLRDMQTLPPAKDRTQKQFTLTPEIFAGSFTIGWTLKAAGGSNKSAFNGGELNRRTQETLTDLGKFRESTYVGTHGTGRRARVESDGSNTFVADDPERTTLLRENYYITVRTTDGGAGVRDSCDFRKITAINHDTYTVTYDGADQTLVAGDHVHVVNALTQTITAPNGLRGIVDDGTLLDTFQGLSRTTYPKLKSNLAGNSGTLRNLTEQILINACHKQRARSGKRVTDAWTSPGQAAKYVEFVAPDRRYNVSGKGIQGMSTGYTEESLQHVYPGGQFNLRISYDLVPREIFLVNSGTFFHYVAADMNWMDEGSLLRLIPASSTFVSGYLAYLASIENIGNDMPIGNTVIRDLKDAVLGDA